MNNWIVDNTEFTQIGKRIAKIDSRLLFGGYQTHATSHMVSFCFMVKKTGIYYAYSCDLKRESIHNIMRDLKTKLELDNN